MSEPVIETQENEVDVVKYSDNLQEQVLNLIKNVRAENDLETDEVEFADLEDPNEEYLNKGGVFYVALDSNGFVVGTIALSINSDTQGEIKRFYLKPEFRKKGIGKALIKQALEFCKKQSLQECVLKTDQKLVKAIEFYRDHGFKIVTDNSGKISMSLNLSEVSSAL